MKGKVFRRLFCLLCVLCLLASCGMQAFAKRPEYKYMVRIFAGQQGKINGKDMMEVSVLADDNNNRVNLYMDAVTLPEDSKYYVKGFRESGKGTEEILGVGSRLSSFIVTKDIDYVVAYGLKGTMVEYTVHFQDAQGNTLAPSETYMGNVGDRPVVAYLYIEGYQPQSYNLTKTLVENPMENVLTFVYTRIETPTTPGTTTVINGGGATVVTPTVPTTPTTPTTGDEDETGEGGGEEGNPDETPEDANAEPTPEEPENVPEENVPAGAPEIPDLVDIDEGEVPLANVNSTPAPTNLDLKGDSSTIFPWWAKLLLGMVVLAALCTVLWFLLFFRKKKEEERSIDLSEITDITALKDLMDDDDDV